MGAPRLRWRICSYSPIFCQRVSIFGSLCGKFAFIEKSVLGRLSVDLSSSGTPIYLRLFRYDPLYREGMETPPVPGLPTRKLYPGEKTFCTLLLLPSRHLGGPACRRDINHVANIYYTPARNSRQASCGISASKGDIWALNSGCASVPAHVLFSKLAVTRKTIEHKLARKVHMIDSITERDRCSPLGLKGPNPESYGNV